MSSRRLTLAVAESEPQHPPHTAVLFRQPVSWVILLGAYMALLCIPGHRRVFLTQVEAVFTRQPPMWLSSATARRSKHRARVQATLRRHPNDPHLQLGAILAEAIEPATGAAPEPGIDSSLRDARLDRLEALSVQFPSDPVVPATYLRYHCFSRIRGGRAEVDRSYGATDAKTRLLAPAILRKVELLANKGARLDPDNGFYPSVLGAAYMAAGREAEGAAALRRASRCSTWKDQAFAEGLAARDLLILTYGDQGIWIHAVPAASVLLPHFAELRQAARAAVWHSKQAGLAGDHGREHAIRADVVRLGGLMRREADSLIGRLVGRSIQDIALRADGRTERRSWASREQLQGERHTYIRRVRREAPELAGELQRELEALEASRPMDYAREWHGPWERPLSPALLRDVAGLFILSNLAGSLGLWLVAALVLPLLAWLRARATQRSGPPGGAFRGPLGVALVTLCAAAAVLPFFVFLVNPESGFLPFYLSIASGGTLLLLALRRRPEPLIWSARDAIFVAATALAIASFATFPRQISIPLVVEFWRSATAESSLLPEITQNLGSNPVGTFLLPLPVIGALMLAGLFRALIRRAPPEGWLTAIRLGSRVVAGVLAAAYLCYFLVAVPANFRDAREFDRLSAQWAQVK